MLFFFSLVRFLCLGGDDLELYIERCVRSPIRFVGRLCSEFTRNLQTKQQNAVCLNEPNILQDWRTRRFLYILYSVSIHPSITTMVFFFLVYLGNQPKPFFFPGYKICCSTNSMLVFPFTLQCFILGRRDANARHFSLRRRSVLLEAREKCVAALCYDQCCWSKYTVLTLLLESMCMLRDGQMLWFRKKKVNIFVHT